MGNRHLLTPFKTTPKSRSFSERTHFSVNFFKNSSIPAKIFLTGPFRHLAILLKSVPLVESDPPPLSFPSHSDGIAAIVDNIEFESVRTLPWQFWNSLNFLQSTAILLAPFCNRQIRYKKCEYVVD